MGNVSEGNKGVLLSLERSCKCQHSSGKTYLPLVYLFLSLLFLLVSHKSKNEKSKRRYVSLTDVMCVTKQCKKCVAGNTCDGMCCNSQSDAWCDLSGFLPQPCLNEILSSFLENNLLQ